MNVLITGIDGFVGSHLAGELLRTTDDRISGFVIDHAHTPLIDHIRDRLELLQVNIRHREDVYRALELARPDKIFHLAGQAYVPNAMKDPLDTFYTNIDGGFHMLEGVRKYFPECSVLVISSGEVYGLTDPSKEIDEFHSLNPNNPYAASKAAIDLITQQYRIAFGLDAVAARSFNHLGPGQRDVFVGAAFARQVAEVKLGLRKPVISVGNLEAKRDFTDVRDVVKAYKALLDGKREYGVYNVCSGRAVAVQEILDRLIEYSGVKVSVERDPDRMRKSDNPVVVGSSRRLQSETGWKPAIPLESTLRDVLSWWENHLSPK